MGGKTKQTQRVKNNAQPSNSGRSAELLGTSLPFFVGFSAHSDLGIIPFAPGFATVENLPETFDSSISAQFQIILKKMSKKDPVTKVKALQEFIDHLDESEIDVVKKILPLWPKFYHNLANDVDHRVREGAQNVQEILVRKCKKAIAPYLKQLAPVWISSQFDSYPPVASVAGASFQSAFASNKVQEVCLFCQQEIIDYIVQNLTFHSASTLSSTKVSTPEEAEQKYQRVVVCSMKMLSFFIEKTSGTDITSSREKIQSILSHQKFWSLSKHRSAQIKSAWFELQYNLLQYAPQLTETTMAELVAISFQNIDNNDPLIIPHVWGCILLLQNTYPDWYKLVNFKKNIQSKLSTFLRNRCKGNADAVASNFLPFFSKFTRECLNDVCSDDFYKTFFADLKEAIVSSPPLSNSDASSLITAFYECLRHLLQRINSITVLELEQTSLVDELFETFIHSLLKWAFCDAGAATKHIFVQTANLIIYWADQPSSVLYTKLLDRFWQVMREDIVNADLSRPHLDNVIEFIINLHNVHTTVTESKVKFVDSEIKNPLVSSNMKQPPKYVQNELRDLAVLLVTMCLKCVSEDKTLPYEQQIYKLTTLYADSKFYAEVSGANDVEVTLNKLTDLLRYTAFEPSAIVVEIIFQILSYLPKEKMLDFIHDLLQTGKPALQQCLLQRLLSYPLHSETEVKNMLVEDNVSEVILQAAREVLTDNAKEKFHLLHKCFFQTDSGGLLITQETVDGILDIMCEPLVNPGQFESMMDSCGQFIAQIMPVVCPKNSSKKAQRDTFLKLFQFSVYQKSSVDLAPSTLSEVSTCWQDALSSEDIILDKELLEKCSEIISNHLSSCVNPQEIENVADIISKLILCSIHHIDNEDKCCEWIDSNIEILLKPKQENFYSNYKLVSKYATFLELTEAEISVVTLDEDACKDVDYDLFFRRSLLNLVAGLKTVCSSKLKYILSNNIKLLGKIEISADVFNKVDDHRWTPKMYDLIVELIKISGLAESLLRNCPNATGNQIAVMTEIMKKTKFVICGIEDNHVRHIREQLLQDAERNDLAAIRSLPFFAILSQYNDSCQVANFRLYEELSDYFISKEADAACVNLLQFMLPNLPPKALNLDLPIMNREVDVWQKCVLLRCLLNNKFSVTENDISDRQIVDHVLEYINKISEDINNAVKERLLHNCDITQKDVLSITRVVEYIYLLTEVLARFPYQLTMKHWDTIRIGLSAWVLTLSKNINNFKNSKIPIFGIALFNLHSQLANFIVKEKFTSSTEALTNMIDEWEILFASEVNIVLFMAFYNFVTSVDSTNYTTCCSILFQEFSMSVRRLDYSVIYNFCKSGKRISLDAVIDFLLNHMSSHVHILRITSGTILMHMSHHFIAADVEQLQKSADIVDAKADQSDEPDDWHLFSKFKHYLDIYQKNILPYLDEFTFKLTELAELRTIDQRTALSYLLLWDCILNICVKAPVELRSVYVSWITRNKYEEKFLHFLFRAMPVEILKNHDSKIMSNDLFKELKWQQIQNEKLQIEKYACHLYSAALSKLPAVVRKWWNGSHSRQKTFVDKLTTNFVSSLICHDELETIVKMNIKDKQPNIQVNVHTSTREVNAVYFIDDARMELIITLAPNYPLGGVKVESGKQIGGRASSRNIAMQLTIFLTHQNGSIFDGLSLWKKNLDKKFEGVEECYVCYTVIHQDTCQLPKLTCKTCRKKFHGPCLYKWFITSSKSTCPICRNIF